MEILNLLIDRGADYNFLDCSKKTPVFYAAKNSNVEVLKMLIDKGANDHALDI